MLLKLPRNQTKMAFQQLDIYRCDSIECAYLMRYKWTILIEKCQCILLKMFGANSYNGIFTPTFSTFERNHLLFRIWNFLQMEIERFNNTEIDVKQSICLPTTKWISLLNNNICVCTSKCAGYIVKSVIFIYWI